MEHNHEMYVRSSNPNSNEPITADVFGELVFKNGLNGKEYVFSIWSNEEDSYFENEDDLEDKFYNTVWMTAIPDYLHLNDKEHVEIVLCDALLQMSLEDFIEKEKYSDVLTKIAAYYLEGVEFVEQIPPSAQLIDLNAYIKEEEVCRMITLATDDNLTAQEVIEFGILSSDGVQVDCEVEYLKPYLEKVTNVELSANEKEKVINAFETLKLELPENLKNNEMEIER